jgi:hypothetical protein
VTRLVQSMDEQYSSVSTLTRIRGKLPANRGSNFGLG